MAKNHLDVLIIGGGPIGIAVALEAQKKELEYLVIEKGTLVNSLYHYPEHMKFFSTPEKLELNDIPFITKDLKPGKHEALEYYRKIVVSNQLKINLFEQVISVQRKRASFEVSTSKGNYITQHIVVATGFYDIPKLLNIPGESLPKVAHYYGDPHYYVGQKVAIIGASNSAVDAALEIYRKGGDVSMFVRRKNLGERVKYWVRPDIENRIAEGSIMAYFNTEVVRITENHIHFKTKTGEEKIDNDFVLALTGYEPNFEFLSTMGIEIRKEKAGDKSLRKPMYDAHTMETNQQGIYLAGVVCGGDETHKWFIENSRVHAPLIIEAILKKKKRYTKSDN
ncbi:MAG: YpdA family putative bacillithiol disulfide reductase [Flavobacteriaceae bacterium]|nr:YpdA family putative bacillithiol disulfide reductase [Flavobacteriaceae bacterium]